MTRWHKPPLFVLALLTLLPGQGAEAYSLMPGTEESRPLLVAAARPLAPAAAAAPLAASPARPLAPPPGAVPAAARPSLFRDRAGASFFAPLPERARLSPQRPMPQRPGTATAQLLHLIASVEADPSKGYDSVQFQARVKPPKPPTAMTLDEIHAWIRATPGQQHAIGRYQIVPQTLRGLQKQLDLPGHLVFDAALQDRMADALLRFAGYDRFLAGKLSRRGFMNNLARVWAALPNSSGRSHYHGLAGNRAAFTWAHFTDRMQAIFPR